MIKVVYNACFGGFGLSRKAGERLIELGVEGVRFFDSSSLQSYRDNAYITGDLPRHDPRLIQVIEEFGAEASGSFSNLKIAEISGDRYKIDEYDGRETVVEIQDEEWIEIERSK